MNFLNQPLFQNIIQSLSWTLIHSLWQGLLLSIFAGAVLLFSKKASPAMRYNLLATLLFVFVPVSGYTFWCEWRDFILPPGQDPGIGGRHAGPDTDVLFFNQEMFTGQSNGFWRILTNFLTANSFYIVFFWLFIFCFKALKAASGFAYIYRLRHVGLHEVGEQWQWELRQLAQRIGVYERIQFISSELTQVPIVTGFFRPMIIVPLGFLSNLPVNQIEAILLHELAHVKRADYLVNLLQSFVETLFFFNPAVLWLSSLIREEREHCCDDIALSVIENKVFFVNALVSFQEYSLSGTPHTLAFAGKRNHLLERIKRIVYSHNKQLNAMEKLFVTASVIAAGLLSVAFAPSEKVLKVPQKVQAEHVVQVAENSQRSDDSRKKMVGTLEVIPVAQSEVPVDTLPRKDREDQKWSRGMMNMSFNDNGKDYKVVQDDGEIVYLKVDGKVIAREEMGQYKMVIDDMLAKSEAARAKAEIEREHADQERMIADEQRRQADLQRDQADEQRRQSDRERERADAIRRKAEGKYGNLDEDRSESDAGIVNQRSGKRSVDSYHKSEAYDRSFEAIRNQAEQARADAEIQRRLADKMRAEADVSRKQADVARREADVMRQKYEKMQAELIGDLVSEGIITDKNNLSYKLSQDELIVNGQKQSDALHEKFRKRFIKDKKVEMVYNWSGRTGYTSTGLIYTR